MTSGRSGSTVFAKAGAAAARRSLGAGACGSQNVRAWDAVLINQRAQQGTPRVQRIGRKIYGASRLRGRIGLQPETARVVR